MRKKSIIGTVGIVIVIAAFIVGVVAFGPGGGEVTELEGVEVTEYQGEDLSSINNFRENSIRGPQDVDIETYQLTVNGLVEKPGTYTYDEIIDDYDSYKKVVRLNCVEG